MPVALVRHLHLAEASHELSNGIDALARELRLCAPLRREMDGTPQEATLFERWIGDREHPLRECGVLTHLHAPHRIEAHIQPPLRVEHEPTRGDVGMLHEETSHQPMLVAQSMASSAAR